MTVASYPIFLCFSFVQFDWLIPMFVGIYEATSLDRSRKDSSHNHDTSNGLLDRDQMSPLPTWYMYVHITLRYILCFMLYNLNYCIIFETWEMISHWSQHHHPLKQFGVCSNQKMVVHCYNWKILSCKWTHWPQAATFFCWKVRSIVSLASNLCVFIANLYFKMIWSESNDNFHMVQFLCNYCLRNFFLLLCAPFLISLLIPSVPFSWLFMSCLSSTLIFARKKELCERKIPNSSVFFYR